MNNDERQLIQVKMIKDDPETADYTKVWIYRNMVYAYPWCVCPCVTQLVCRTSARPGDVSLLLEQVHASAQDLG